jgi:hypothetical protein
VGAQPESLLRWQNNAWVEISDASDWDGSRGQRWRENLSANEPIGLMGPDQAGVLALWPSPHGGVESLWASTEPRKRRKSDQSEQVDNITRTTRLYHYRHTGEQSRLRLREAHYVSRITSTSTQYVYGDAWTAAPLRHLMPHADGVWLLASEQSNVGSLGLRYFSNLAQERALAEFPATNLDVRRLYQPRAVLDAHAAIWLCGETSPWSRNQKLDKPRFFARFHDGSYDFAPAIKDLPARDEVTEFALLPGGTQAVAAVAGAGLWTIDLQPPFHAKSRSSPPIPPNTEIWSWQGWADGMEAVLASDPDEANRANHEAFWAVLWLKTGDSWAERGRFRVDTWQGYGMRQLPATPLKWIRWDDHLILTGNRRLYVLSLRNPSAKAVPLDWSYGFMTTRPKAAYTNPAGDELIVVGNSTTRLRSGELAARLATEPSPIVELEDCLRGADGHLFAVMLLGPGRYRLAHWNGWSLVYYSLPPDATGRTLLQDDTGRLWLIDQAEKPAWTLNPLASAPEWKRYDRLLNLIADYARMPGPKNLRGLQNSNFVLPAWNSDGRVMVQTSHQNYQILTPEGWISLPKLEAERGAESVSFSTAGAPEVAIHSDDSNLNQLWRWQESAGWRPAGTLLPSRYGRRSEAAAKPVPEPPEWIKTALGPIPAFRVGPTIVAENDRTWWVLYGNQVWRAEAGLVSPALRANISHPWMRDGATSLLQAVETDTLGNRYFWYYDEVVIVPTTALAP